MSKNKQKRRNFSLYDPIYYICGREIAIVPQVSLFSARCPTEEGSTIPVTSFPETGKTHRPVFLEVSGLGLGSGVSPEGKC